MGIAPRSISGVPCRSKGGLDLAASEPPFSLLLKGLALVCPGRPTRATGQKGLLPGGSNVELGSLVVGQNQNTPQCEAS